MLSCEFCEISKNTSGRLLVKLKFIVLMNLSDYMKIEEFKFDNNIHETCKNIIIDLESFIRMCSVKKSVLLQYSKENTCVRVSF